MEQEQDDGQVERLVNLFIGGGIMGGLGGAGAGAFGGKFRKLSDLMTPAAIGAGATGGLAAGSGYVGDELLGEPTEDETSPYTYRTAVGGLAAGAGLGGLGGAAAGSGLLNKTIKKNLEPDNLIRRTIERMQEGGRLKASGKLGAIGAALGGLGTGFLAADEGMGIDVLMNEKKKREQERLGL